MSFSCIGDGILAAVSEGLLTNLFNRRKILLQTQLHNNAKRRWRERDFCRCQCSTGELCTGD